MARPVVSAHFPQRERRPWLRLAPAAAFSIAVHAILMALFMFLAPTSSADSALQLEVRDETPLHAIPIDDAPKADFLSGDYNDFSTERDIDNNNFSDRLADKTIHEIDRPDLGLGSGIGVETPEILPPPFGMPGKGFANGNHLAAGDGNAKVGPFGGMLNGRPGIDLSQRGSGATREKALRMNGGTPATEAAVTRGLRWLVRQQGTDGGWRLDGNFPNAGKIDNKTAGTALALLPFLGAGKTHKPGAKEANPYDKPVEKGLLFLMRQQDKNSGYLGGGMYARSWFGFDRPVRSICSHSRPDASTPRAKGVALHRARPTRRRRVALSARRSGGSLRFRLADHGPQERHDGGTGRTRDHPSQGPALSRNHRRRG
ncbi:MAG: hypothetical protein K2X38_04925 [Gemmataceae bacterium]|nr:hypothetical protein [Gemmataceae bacterium]